MKKIILPLLTLTLALVGCSEDTDKLIKVCASEIPHAEILNEVVKPQLEEKGYELEVTILDWSIQNEATYQGDYDANYFQHRPYLQQYDSNSANYVESYTYTKLFPTAAVHFEPLRVYEGKSKAQDFESKKTTATFEICADPSNAIRALDLLKSCGAITSYEVDSNGNPLEDKLPSRIKLIAEELLVANKDSYDYAVLPCNTALTGNIVANTSLPTETEEVKDLRANIIAASVDKYQKDEVYKAKIDVLSDAVLSSKTADYILEKYNNVSS
ncbi:MAG: MetQ/NlpA family ABC transporter substrate-binding protein [Bacilli bacterium]|nr:MetQ/NlpA family ABC transporter substrate-binding protein [Bacilli bacterium]